MVAPCSSTPAQSPSSTLCLVHRFSHNSRNTQNGNDASPALATWLRHRQKKKEQSVHNSHACLEYPRHSVGPRTAHTHTTFHTRSTVTNGNDTLHSVNDAFKWAFFFPLKLSEKIGGALSKKKTKFNNSLVVPGQQSFRMGARHGATCVTQTPWRTGGRTASPPCEAAAWAVRTLPVETPSGSSAWCSPRVSRADAHHWCTTRMSIHRVVCPEPSSTKAGRRAAESGAARRTGWRTCWMPARAGRRPCRHQTVAAAGTGAQAGCPAGVWLCHCAGTRVPPPG